MPSSSSAAYQDSPDLFTEDVEIDTVGSPYSEQIATPGCSLEPSAVVAVAAEDDVPSDDPSMQQSGQDLSVLERDWSEHSEEQTHQEHDDDASSDEGEEAGGTRAKNITLTKKKEAEIVEWLQDNTFLYDRGHPLYKNKAKKTRTMEQQAKKLGLKREELARWIHTKRTRFGKLTKMAKSGTGATDAVGQMDPQAVPVPGPSYRQTTGDENARNWQGKNKQFFFFLFWCCKVFGWNSDFFFLYIIQTSNKL